MDERDLKELAELQDPDAWDYEHAEPYPAAHLPRAVVTVTFQGEDFIRVTKQAEQRGMTLTDFIREAVLDKAEQPSLR